MTNKIIFTFLLLSLFFSCKTNYSNRGGSITEADTFLFDEVVEYKDSSKYKEVYFDIEHENIDDLDHLTFQMYVHNGPRQIIFKGDKKNMRNMKIKIPNEFQTKYGYLISIFGIDYNKNHYYVWSSDGSYHLNDKSSYIITLLYSRDKAEKLNFYINPASH